MVYSPSLGAVTQLYAATAEEAGDYGGKVCPVLLNLIRALDDFTL